MAYLLVELRIVAVSAPAAIFCYWPLLGDAESSIVQEEPLALGSGRENVVLALRPLSSISRYFYSYQREWGPV
jgi:hypothetical protein